MVVNGVCYASVNCVCVCVVPAEMQRKRDNPAPSEVKTRNAQYLIASENVSH